jgi:hypothetical protein
VTVKGYKSRSEEGVVDGSGFRWDNPIMKVVADSRGRIAAREFFPPGTVFDIQTQPNGHILVIELVEKQTPRARLIRSSGGTRLESETTFTNEDVQKAMEEFP